MQILDILISKSIPNVVLATAVQISADISVSNCLLQLSIDCKLDDPTFDYYMTGMCASVPMANHSQALPLLYIQIILIHFGHSWLSIRINIHMIHMYSYVTNCHMSQR